MIHKKHLLHEVYKLMGYESQEKKYLNIHLLGYLSSLIIFIITSIFEHLDFIVNLAFLTFSISLIT